MNSSIKTAFRWYVPHATGIAQETLATLQHGSRYPDSPWELIASQNTLLPFQFFIPAAYAHIGDLAVTEWALISADGTSSVDLSGSAGMLELFQASGKGVWWIFKGEEDLPDPLPAGTWYSYILLESGRYVVSERFTIRCTDGDLRKLTRLEWYNGCDTAGIIYQTGFRNLLYFEGEPEQVEPVVVEEGQEDGNKLFVPTLVTYVNQYRWDELAPAFIVEALAAIRLHDTRQISLNRAGELHLFDIAIKDFRGTWDADGKLALASMKIEMDQHFIKTGCCSNETLSTFIPMVTVNDTIRIRAGQVSTAVTQSILANDTGYNLSVASGTLATQAGGSIAFNPNGTYTYTPPTSGYTGTDHCTVVIQDGLGSTDTSTLTLRVDYTHAVADFYEMSYVQSSLVVAAAQGVLANDFFPWNYPVSGPKIYSLGNLGSQVIQSLEADGNYINLDNNTGAFVFTKVVNPAGSQNTFNYRIYTAPGVAGPNTLITIGIV